MLLCSFTFEFRLLVLFVGRVAECSFFTYLVKDETFEFKLTMLRFSMQKVSVNGPKQTLFLLWEINKESLWVLVLDEMYHASLNLRLRITYELDQEKEVCLSAKQLLLYSFLLCTSCNIIKL